MNTYSYRIYRNKLNNPIIGGTVTSADMESAAQKVIKLNGVEVIHEVHNGLEYHRFEFRGSKVGILLYVNPEDF